MSIARRNRLRVARVIDAILAGLMLSAGAYCAVWGASWLIGSRAAFVESRGGGSVQLTYPGVLFGGMPPVPTGDDQLVLIVAVLTGATLMALGLVYLLVRLRTGRGAVHPSETR